MIPGERRLDGLGLTRGVVPVSLDVCGREKLGKDLVLPGMFPTREYRSRGLGGARIRVDFFKFGEAI